MVYLGSGIAYDGGDGGGGLEWPAGSGTYYAGGGGGKPNDTYNCAGGSGIVIVRYPI